MRTDALMETHQIESVVSRRGRRLCIGAWSKPSELFHSVNNVPHYGRVPHYRGSILGAFSYQLTSGKFDGVLPNARNALRGLPVVRGGIGEDHARRSVAALGEIV